jgi:outer membrane protein
MIRAQAFNFSVPCVTACWLLVSPVYGESDLKEIYNLALENDPTYRAALIDNQADQVDLPLAKTAFRPSITADGEVGRQQSDVTGSTRNTDDNLINLNLNLPVYDRPARLNIGQTENEVQISNLEIENARHNLILRVADRYFNVLASQDAREVARVERIAIQRQMDLARERLEVGLGTRTDLFDAQARFKQAEADEIRTQNLIDNNIALLKQIIGVTPESLVTLSSEAPLELPEPNDVDTWILKSSEQNIPLKIEKLNLEVALQEIDIQGTARWPTVSVGAPGRALRHPVAL